MVVFGTCPAEFEVIVNVLDDGTVMVVCYWEWLVYGVQFHFELVLIVVGYQIFRNFLEFSCLLR